MASSLHVFISFKNLDDKGLFTRDSALAREVYEYLTSQGLKVFLSNISLEQMGADEYKRAIDNALDEAVVMIAVGTSPENLNSKWVRYEWDSFFNDILSGLKHGSRFFTYVENVDTKTLPRTIRHNQVFKHPDDLPSMHQYIVKALAARALHLAREAMDSGYYEKAIQYLSEAVEREPDNVEVISELEKARQALAAGQEARQQETEARPVAEQKKFRRGNETFQPVRGEGSRTFRRKVLSVIIGVSIVAVLVTAFLVIMSQRSASRITLWLAQAERAVAERHYRGARDLYRRVLRVDGRNDLARAGLAATEKRLKDIDRQITPSLISGERAFLAKRLDTAKRQFMIVLGIDAENTKARQALNKIRALEVKIQKLLRLARSALAANRLTEAKSHFLKIVSLNAEHKASRQALDHIKARRRRIDRLLASARSAMAQKKLTAVKDLYLKVLSLDSDHSSAKQGLAKIQSVQKQANRISSQARRALSAKRLERARELVERALVMDATNAAAREIQTRLGKIEERIRSLLTKANALEKSGQIDQALKLYRQVLAENPGQPKARAAVTRLRPRAARVKAKAHHLLSQALESQKAGNWARVIRLTTEALQLDSGLVRAYATRGTAQLMLSRFKSALEDYNRAIARGLTDKRALATVYGNRCFALLRLDRVKQALADCSRCISLAPKMAEAYGVRSMIYRRLGKTAEARRDEVAYERLKRP